MSLTALVLHMHDQVCRCGGFCDGAASDLAAIKSFAADRWGSSLPLIEYLSKDGA